MTLSKQQTLSILRSLTCALCAAVLAWSGLTSNVYADVVPDSISINLGADRNSGQATPTGGDLGVVPVNYQYWNNASGKTGSMTLISNTGAATGLSGSWESSTTYNGGTFPSRDNNAILFYGYLDDGAVNSHNAYFSMTAPYFSYDIYYYAATDSTVATPHRYVNINTVDYCGDSNGTKVGTDNWGTQVSGNITADDLVEGRNYLVVSSSDPTISVLGSSKNGSYRGSFGALQIVNTANSQSTITTNSSLVLSSASWTNDLTGETNQSISDTAIGYRIIYTGTATDTFTVDLNGATSLPNVRLFGNASNLSFTNFAISQLGETNKVLDLSGTNITLPQLYPIAKQGVVKVGSGVTFAEPPADQSLITGAYFIDASGNTSFACVKDGAFAPVTPTQTLSDDENIDYLVTGANVTDNTARVVNSLTTQFDYINNKSLTVKSGMITLLTKDTGYSHWIKNGASITSGYLNADGEYDLYLAAIGDGNNLRIHQSYIVDPGANKKLNVIKSGNGVLTLALGTSTYSGKTSVLEGQLYVCEQISSTDFYVANNAQLHLSAITYNTNDLGATADFSFTATSLSGYGVVEIGNNDNRISLTLNNVVNDGSKFARVNAYGKALNLNNSELRAEYVDNNSAITLANSTLVADTLNGSATSKVTITGNSSFNVDNIAGTVTLEIPENETQTINTVISGSGELVKAGKGTLELTANNTYSGNTQINGGVLDLTEGKLYSGAYAVADVYVNDGGTLKVNHFGYAADGRGSLGGLTYSSNGSTNFHLNGGTVQIAESFGEAINRKIELQTNGGTFDLPEGVELTLGSDVHGAGGLTKAGAGTLTLSLQPAYTGATTINAGKLITTAGGTLHNLSGVASATLDNNGQAITVNNSADTVFSGTITGAGSFTKTGSGKLEITNKMAYTGDTTVSAGTLQLNGAAGGNKFFQGAVTIAAGATLKCNVHDTLGYNSDEKVFNIYGTLDNAFKNESLRNTTLNLYGGTICSTDTTNGGQLDILNKDASSTGNKIFSYALEGATAANPTVSTISSKINLRTNGTLEIDTAANSTLKITGKIVTGSDSCSITKLGPGTLVLSANNEYKADTFVNAGTLELTAGGNKGTLPPGRAVTVDGATSVLAGYDDILGYNNKTARGAIGSLTLSAGGTLYCNNSEKHITVNNVVYMNNGVITALGAGTEGKFNFYFDNTIHVTGGENNKITAAGIRLRNLNTYTAFADGDFAGLIDVADGAKLTISSVIEAGSNVGMTKSGAGELVMTANSAGFTKGTTISQGTLTLEESGALGTGAVAIAQNAVLNLNHEGAARFDNSVTGVALDPDDPDSEIGYGKIYKNGNGVLKILNNTPGAFATDSFVVNAGELDFKGYFKGALEIGEDATFSPGNSIGTLTIDGTEVDPQMSAFSLDSGATLLMEVGYDENNVWTSDKLVVNGEVVINPESTIILTLLEGTALPSGEFTIDLISGTGATEDTLNAVASVLSAPYFTDYRIELNGGVIQLTSSIDFNAVPEPSTWALLALGALGLLYWRKRKN